MTNNNKNELLRHLSFAAVGGFFALYAVLCRSGFMGNAQTLNLLELLKCALSGDKAAVLWHLGALFMYILGTMCSVFLPHFFGVRLYRAVAAVDLLACALLFFIPEDANNILALYPIFFAMSLQWNCFSGARGYVSSTIFSTNNTRQASLALANYICGGDKSQLLKLHFFLCTLLCFHAGAALAFFAVKLFSVRGIALNAVLIIFAEYRAVLEKRESTVKTA